MGRKKVNDLTNTTRNKLLERQIVISKICALRAPMWDTKSKRMKPRMGIGEACEKAGITLQSFNSWRRADASLDKIIQEVEEASMDMVRDLSQNIIQDGLTGVTKLRPNEKIQLAKWALEKTSPEFNPAIKVENKNLNVNIDMSDDEILQRLKDLGINNYADTRNNNNDESEYPSSTDGTTEYGDYEEATYEEGSSGGEYSSSTSEGAEEC